MKERPILFQGAMVRALLAGTKSQTRRAIKPQPDARCTEAFLGADGVWRFSYPTTRAPVSHADWDVRCPYGQPGDRLWVREAFTLEHCVDGNPPPFNDGRPIKHRSQEDVDGITPLWRQPHYRATDPEPALCYEDGDNEPRCKWTPSIHMPRWASRILLEVTEVRVQRLWDISEADARAEGWDGTVLGYAKLWDQINGAGSWDANPWVWALSFRRVQP